MLEFLSDKTWLAPQIDVLLYLQNIRTLGFEYLNPVLLHLTTFGEFLVPTILSALVYWCIDTRAGIYLFSLESMNIILSLIMKMLACVYRPWVLSDKITPVKEALPLAYGYSFPSGHSAQASSVLGGFAFLLRKKKTLVILLILLILLTGFSRLWLGVHTPQDVLTGLTLGLVLVFLMNGMVNWAEKDRNRYLYLIAAINLISAITLVYLSLKSYPMDYIDGVLVVDPKHPLQGTFFGFGYALGLLNGAFLSKIFFPFEASCGTILSKTLRFIIGAVIIVFVLNNVMGFVFNSIDNFTAVFAAPFILGFFITAVYPLIFKSIKFLYK